MFPDGVEVLVYSGEAGPTLVAAVELVSPGNKDRPDARRAFAAKCAAYLQQGVGLVVVDVVTNRSADLHAELAVMVHAPMTEAGSSDLHAAAYRPVRPADESAARIDVWTSGLAVGRPLPVLPLALDKGRVVPLDLEASYTVACERRRIPQFPRPAV